MQSFPRGRNNSNDKKNRAADMKMIQKSMFSVGRGSGGGGGGGG